MTSARTLFILLLSIFSTTVPALWPQPNHAELGTSVLWLSEGFQIALIGHNATYYPPLQKVHKLTDYAAGDPSQVSEAHILQSAIQRTEKSVASTRFVPWKLHPRKVDFEPAVADAKTYISSVRISQRTKPAAFEAQNFFTGDESYLISVATDGTATITSNTTIGTIRALQTFEQLFYAHSSGTGVYMPYAPLEIQDGPQWRHRGVNVDIARNPFSPRDLRRTLDAMATAKMSRLHLHASDGQSWPLEIPAMPQLAAMGAYRPYLTWSPKDLLDVQLYGLYRGISVFIEIDMPGHTASIANAYPELITAFNESDWSTFAAEPPSGQLKLNSSAVYNFLESLFADLLPRLAPYTINFHNGGDEVNNNAFLLDETVRSNSSAVLQPLVQKLMSHVTNLVTNAGLGPIVWEEMLLDWNLTFVPTVQPSTGSETDNNPLGTIIQVWRSSDNLLLVLQKGYRAVFGDYNHWYLDCGHGGFINPYPSGFSPPGIPYNTSGGVPTQIHDPFLDYCNPLKNWRHIYVYNPLANITSPALESLIEGGEVHMWTEQTDPVNLDQRLWPRAAAAAEVMWSGPRDVGMIEGASKRLAEWRERVVVDHGVGSGMVQMTWCLMEGGCDL